MDSHTIVFLQKTPPSKNGCAECTATVFSTKDRPLFVQTEFTPNAFMKKWYYAISFEMSILFSEKMVDRFHVALILYDQSEIPIPHALSIGHGIDRGNTECILSFERCAGRFVSFSDSLHFWCPMKHVGRFRIGMRIDAYNNDTLQWSTNLHSVRTYACVTNRYSRKHLFRKKKSSQESTNDVDLTAGRECAIVLTTVQSPIPISRVSPVDVCTTQSGIFARP
jgi:hypothetical protein